MATYELCGLRVDSPVALPGAPPAGDGRPPDVRFHLGQAPAASASWDQGVVRPVHVSEARHEGAPVVVADRPAPDGTLRLRYAEGVRVHVSPRGDDVWCDWRPPMTEADALTFLVGPALGVVLRRHGLLALHASAVVVDGVAAAFLGPRGSGKSTLAAACAAAGFPLLAEDVLALRRDPVAWQALPAYGAIRLWDDSAELVAGDRTLPRLTPTWEKRALDVEAAALPMAGAPVPLGAVLVLDDFVAGEAEPAIRAIGAAELLVELVANVYVNQFATREELAGDLGPLRDLAAAVRGHRLRPGHGKAGLAGTVEAVARTLRRALY